MNCSVCKKRTDAAYSITHTKCGHATHTECFVEDQHDFNYCEGCLRPAAAAESVEGGPKKSIEPRLKDGRDYVNNPGRRPSILSAATSVVGSALSFVARRSPAAPARKTPAELLREKTPIEDIFRYGYGLDHMLAEGVTIDDFIASRYKWNDLCAFEDVSQEGPRRALDTFVNGLKMNANHLKNHADLLPFDKFKELTQLETSELCTRLGMEFPVDACLQCEGKTDWNAKDCVRLGLTIDDLRDFGLYCQEQYVELMEGLSAAEQRKAERDLGVTPELFGTLRSLKAEEAEQQKKEQEARQRSRQQYVGEQEEEEEEEEDSSSAAIAAEAAEAAAEAVPFVYEHRFRPNNRKAVEAPKQRVNKLAYLGYTSRKK